MDVDKNIRISKGLLLSMFVITVPAFAWILGYNANEMVAEERLGFVIEKTAAFSGMAMFAWSLILSGRYQFFDLIFGGLDKVYRAHKFFGTASLALLVLHPLGYTLSYIASNGTGDLIGHFLGYKSLAFTLGRLSLYGLILFVLLSIFIKMKHETFIKTHRFLGLFFIVGAAHAFMSGDSSILANNQFIWWYMALLSLLAALTFVHYSLLNDFVHKKYTYKITYKKKLTGNVWDIRLKPRFRIINFLPGQFVYLSFNSKKDTAYHPFTIASGNRTSELQFYIKELGDFTSTFESIRLGSKVYVKGPYGGFTFEDSERHKQLWIAGGIGITPFLSKARSLNYSRKWPQIELLYAVRSKKDAIAVHELHDIEEKSKSFNLTLLHQTKFGVISLTDIQDQFSNIHDYEIYICGPPAMLKAYVDQAKALGIPDSQIHFEEFNF